MRIVISAGEQSGDEHAAGFVSALMRFNRQAQVSGMGGRNLRAIGVDTIVDSESSASLMGFHEVLLSGRKVYGAWRAMRQTIKLLRPDLLVLVDYPDFNLNLAKFAHKHGVRVFYFITPQVWAWRTGRVELFKRYISQAAVIFPFERDFFHSRGYNRSVFVGHPFTDLLPSLTQKRNSIEFRQQFCHKFGLDPARPILTVFPGSRKNELARHLPVIKEALALITGKHPQVQACLAAADSVAELLETSLQEGDSLGNCRVVRAASLDLLCASDAALLKSGTSNLQGAFVGVPFSMFFNASGLSAFIARNFLHIHKVSIVNVVRDNSIREILQEAVTPEELASEAERLLFDSRYRSEATSRLKRVVEDLSSFDALDIFEGCTSAYERAAKLALSVS